MKFIALTFFIIQATLASVVIDCTFPCKITTEACVVSSTSVKCAPVSNNQWILRSRNSIPVFQGTLSGISQTCQSVPFPTLPTASSSSISTSTTSISNNSAIIANSTETIIEWPPINIRNPYDKYLGNCESNAFCSDQLVCTQRYNPGHYCESTHQCVQGSLCTEYTCQVTSLTEPSSGLNTIHIIAAIVGVVLAIVVLLAIYLFRRRRNRRHAAGKSTDNEQQQHLSIRGVGGVHRKPDGVNGMSATSASATSASATSSATTSTAMTLPHSTNMANSQLVTTILSYEAHFENNDTTSSSPSQQQQELQYQLQRQAYHDHKEMAALSPPPYTP